MKQEILHLLMSETLDVQQVHPALELLAFSDSVILRGTVSFDMGSGSGRITDAYQLVMRFPDDYPTSPPVPYETGGAIPRTFEHVFRDGSCCLGAPAEVRRRFREHKSLRRFINERATVVPSASNPSTPIGKFDGVDARRARFDEGAETIVCGGVSRRDAAAIVGAEGDRRRETPTRTLTV